MDYIEIKELMSKIPKEVRDFHTSYKEMCLREKDLSLEEKLPLLYEKLSLSSCFMSFLVMVKEEVGNFIESESIVNLSLFRSKIQDLDELILDIRALLYSLSESIKSIRINQEKTSKEENV